MSNDQFHIIGEVVFLGLLAEPFFHSATDLLMHEEYGKAAVGYVIGVSLALIGLIVLGVIDLGPLKSQLLRGWIGPVAGNIWAWLGLLFLTFVWLSGPRFVERIQWAMTSPPPSAASTASTVPHAHADIAAKEQPQAVAARLETPLAREASQPIETPQTQAGRYFKRFNPPRPMADLVDREWISLGTLYSTNVQRGSRGGTPWEKRYLILLFLPDTRPIAEYALLLLLYGYWKIYNHRDVSAEWLEESLFQSGLRKEVPFELLLSPFELRRLNIDDVAQSHSIDGLISEKINLAKGGYYKLTDKGMTKAQEMFADLERRA
jgi:hypothetical protein